MNQFVPKQSNPLAGFMRQPKIYIRLPSGGEFWPEGSIVIPENNEFPVYSMTAKDELALKIPDALMNGQAVVDVIQSCIPNIKNAWMTPSIDLDLILIAIRLATYGEIMNTPLSFGEDVELNYQVDLRTVMDSLLNQVKWNSVVPVNIDLTVYVRPLTYKNITEAAIQTFETQKIMQIVNNDSLNEDEKLSLFKESFAKLTNSTVGVVSSSVYRVESSQGSTDNPEFIKEFINNTDKEVFNKIQEHLEMLREQNTLKPIVVPVTEEMKAQGVKGETVEVPLIFDPTTFFG